MKILLDKIMYEKELSVRQVSIATGISKSTISRIMCGSVSPTMEVMERIAEGLKMHISDLYDSSFK